MPIHIGCSHDRAVSAHDFDCQERARMSRQQVAERLVDLAYALTAGRPLELKIDGERVRVPVPEELLFERGSKSRGDSVELDLELSWTSGD
jgi:amphi-Trp domain-containing protein